MSGDLVAARGTIRDGAHDFDFLFGRWRVLNRRLRGRLNGSTDWEEFEAIAVARPLWGGSGNTDEIVGESPSGPVRGVTLRLYQRDTGQWRIYWASERTGVVDPPMIGGFRDGRGEFYAQELHEGQAVYSRFIWSGISPDGAHWEQALSDDGGATWETNWTMDLIRTASSLDSAEVPTPSVP